MKKTLGLLVFALFIALGGSYAHATSLNGWAWSGGDATPNSGFGWISFNSSDTGAGGGPYAVSIDSSGNWSGYAWSSERSDPTDPLSKSGLGWISFNASDLTNCPGASAAKLGASGEVTGWAYALVYAGTASPSSGCIELSGTNHASPGSGVTYNTATGIFSGYAWGADTGLMTGPGWIQFDTTNPVKCQSAGCGYTGNITGTCTAITPYRNIAPGASVTFEGSGTSGDAPYSYKWGSNAWDSETPTNRFSVSFAASGSGPILLVRDNNGLTSQSISCPTVTVLTPLGATNFKIGRTAATATRQSLTVRQGDGFALLWDLTLDENYSCVPSIKDPNGAAYGNANWNTWTGNFAPVNNGDGTARWSGDTDNAPFTKLTAGTAAAPISPGIYRFNISCTGLNLDAQSTSVELKVNSSSEREI